MINFFQRKPRQTAKLPFKTDVHCHIVPGVDDGSPDAATSADLVERMQSWGIETILASPHVAEVTFENTPDTLDTALQELNDELERRGNKISVTRHGEYRLDDYFRSQLAQGIVTAMPGKHLLVENSFLTEPLGLDNQMFELKMQGFSPILAHPERYSYYRNAGMDRYEVLHASGLLLQINLLSLADYYGTEERLAAEWLVEHNLVDLLGTDLHHHKHADAIDKWLRTSRAEKILRKLDGRLYNDRLGG